MNGAMIKTPSPPHPSGQSPVSAIDLREEALARIRLRHKRARPVRTYATPFGQAARRVTRKAAKQGGSPLAILKDQWPEIVGEEIARYCRPEKITGNKAGRTLTLLVLPAAAPLIQHQSETIRQRVSVAAGGDIAKLKITQGQLGPARRKPSPTPKRTLSPNELTELEASTEAITDPALRQAIVALGKAVLSEKD